MLLAVVFAVGKGFDGGDRYWTATQSSKGDHDANFGGDNIMVAESAIVEDSSSLKSAVPTSYESYEDEFVMDIASNDTLIIKTGSLTLNVKKTVDTMEAITAVAKAYGGFVQDSNTWLQSNETTAGSVTLRVDVENFEQAIYDIKALASVVTAESISGQDVTEQYVDMQSQLINLRAEEAQYLEILERAYTVEDLLNASDYLAGVRGDIEYIEGQLKYLENRTSFSTITIYVYEEASIVAPTSDWKPFVLVKESFNQLVVIMQGMVGLIIWLVIVWVPILVGAYVVYRIGRWGWRKYKK